jgi:branched-chain amino acid transport system permease protein
VADFVQAVYTSLVLGSIYALIAIAYTLIFGVVRFLNLALGSIFAVGGYVAWILTVQLGMPPIVGVIGAFAAAAVIGVLIQEVAVRPLLRKPNWDVTTIIATLGISIMIETAILLIWGPRNKAIPPLASGGFQLGAVLHVDYEDLVVFGIAIVVLGAMTVFLRRSRHGLAVRAVAQNIDAAYLQGVPVYRTFSVVMAISAGLAAVAGVLLSAVYFISPTVGLTTTLTALVITIFGGLGSVPGTLAAAFIVGALESFTGTYLGGRWTLPVLYGLLMIVLLIRPSGIAGRLEVERV